MYKEIGTCEPRQNQYVKQKKVDYRGNKDDERRESLFFFYTWLWVKMWVAATYGTCFAH